MAAGLLVAASSGYAQVDRAVTAGRTSAQSDSATLTGASHGVVVEPNILVSAARSQLAHVEVLAGADPHDPNHLIACSIVSPAGEHFTPSSTIVYASRDGGSHWAAAFQPPASGESWSDPACAIGPDGAAYFSTIYGRSGFGTDVYTAPDGGTEWHLLQHLKVADRSYLTLDTLTDRTHGRVYVHGWAVVNKERLPEAPATPDEPVPPDTTITPAYALVVYSSEASNGRFGEPTYLTSIPGRDLRMGAGAIAADHAFHAIVVERPMVPGELDGHRPPHQVGDVRDIVVTDSGADWNRVRAHPISTQTNCDNFLDSDFAVAASDLTGGRFHGRLYAVWPTQRGGRCAIVLAYSADGGHSWSTPVTADDTPAGRGFGPSMPAVAVNRKGVVGVMWYDRRDTRSGLERTVRFAASFDGGVTFEPSVPVSSAAQQYSLRHALPLSSFPTGPGDPPGPLLAGKHEERRLRVTVDAAIGRGGETAGLVADAAGMFHAVWVDNRTGLSQVWTARIRVAGAASEGGVPELDSLADVTSAVALTYSAAIYEPRTHTVTVEATLRGASDAAGAGPFTVRATRLGTPFGTLQAVDTDNRRNGSDAAWTFTSLADTALSAVAPPGATRRLRFRISDTPLLRREDSDLYGIDFVNLTVRIYARRPVGVAHHP